MARQGLAPKLSEMAEEGIRPLCVTQYRINEQSSRHQPSTSFNISRSLPPRDWWVRAGRGQKHGAYLVLDGEIVEPQTEKNTRSGVQTPFDGSVQGDSRTRKNTWPSALTPFEYRSPSPGEQPGKCPLQSYIGPSRCSSNIIGFPSLCANTKRFSAKGATDMLQIESGNVKTPALPKLLLYQKQTWRPITYWTGQGTVVIAA
ncbi:hypothetical protein B0H14DRAFT_2603463 [Mycena olivaceomarginata]|nr:hypothetical protein B0H14DRAFT_2603463 [Mycena olivaceomarginata]